MSEDQGGRFRINRVTESTGIPEATLRAWERRYHVPKPSRTPSGYRLYSRDDVEQVRKMRELCEAGMSPADAAKEILLARQQAERDASARTTRAADAMPRAATAEGAEARLIEVVAPEHTNTAGVLALSRAVDLMERAANVAAARGTRSAAVVVSCGSVDLIVPVEAGQLIEAIARVVAAREGSISVDVELSAEDVPSGKREHIARSTFLLVLLDAQTE